MFPKFDEFPMVADCSLAVVDMRPPPPVLRPPPLPVGLSEYMEFPPAPPPVEAKPNPPSIDDAVLLWEDAVASNGCVWVPWLWLLLLLL